MNREGQLSSSAERLSSGEKNPIIIDLSVTPYKVLPTKDKQRIFNLFGKGNITNSQIANSLNEQELVSAVEQFYHSVRILEGEIELVIESGKKLYIYRGSKGNLIGAAFSFKKSVKKYDKWNQNPRLNE